MQVLEFCEPIQSLLLPIKFPATILPSSRSLPPHTRTFSLFKPTQETQLLSSSHFFSSTNPKPPTSFDKHAQTTPAAHKGAALPPTAISLSYLTHSLSNHLSLYLSHSHLILSSHTHSSSLSLPLSSSSLSSLKAKPITDPLSLCLSLRSLFIFFSLDDCPILHFTHHHHHLELLATLVSNRQRAPPKTSSLSSSVTPYQPSPRLQPPSPRPDPNNHQLQHDHYHLPSRYSPPSPSPSIIELSTTRRRLRPNPTRPHPHAIPLLHSSASSSNNSPTPPSAP